MFLSGPWKRATSGLQAGVKVSAHQRRVIQPVKFACSGNLLLVGGGAHHPKVPQTTDIDFPRTAVAAAAVAAAATLNDGGTKTDRRNNNKLQDA